MAEYIDTFSIKIKTPFGTEFITKAEDLNYTSSKYLLSKFICITRYGFIFGEKKRQNYFNLHKKTIFILTLEEYNWKIYVILTLSLCKDRVSNSNMNS